MINKLLIILAFLVIVGILLISAYAQQEDPVSQQISLIRDTIEQFILPIMQQNSDDIEDLQETTILLGELDIELFQLQDTEIKQNFRTLQDKDIELDTAIQRNALDARNADLNNFRLIENLDIVASQNERDILMIKQFLNMTS